MMPGIPPWLAVPVVAVSLITVVHSAQRLLAGGPWTRAGVGELHHLVMAVAMLAMVVPATMHEVPPTLGAGVFAASAAGWLALAVADRRRGRRPASGAGRHPVHLALLDAAMVVMYLRMPTDAMDAMSPTGPMNSTAPMPSAAPSPVLTAVSLALGAYLLASLVAAPLVAWRRRPTPAERTRPAPVPAGHHAPPVGATAPGGDPDRLPPAWPRPAVVLAGAMHGVMGLFLLVS